MALPLNSDSAPDGGHLLESQVSPPPPGPILSIESQLQLRALYEHVDACRMMLSNIRMDLSLLESNFGSSRYVRRASEHLGNLCIEADSWGFDSLYEIALNLQMLLLESGNREQDDDFREALKRGMMTLTGLVEKCENDFRWRLAVADTLNCIKSADRY
jgi:hypothetical protein